MDATRKQKPSTEPTWSFCRNIFFAISDVAFQSVNRFEFRSNKCRTLFGISQRNPFFFLSLLHLFLRIWIYYQPIKNDNFLMFLFLIKMHFPMASGCVFWFVARQKYRRNNITFAKSAFYCFILFSISKADLTLVSNDFLWFLTSFWIVILLLRNRNFGSEFLGYLQRYVSIYSLFSAAVSFSI